MLSTEKENTGLQNKATYINFNGLMARLMGQKECNELIKLKNGYLSWPGYSYEKSSLDIVFISIQALFQQQAEQGKDFLFVLAPAKNYQSEQYYPVGHNDTANHDVLYLLELLKKNGIPYLDLREKLVQDSIPYEEIFYITDHHWTTQTGFWAFTQILETMKNNGSIEADISSYVNPKNYQFTIYEDSFLGSLGKRTGICYAGVDDFCVITPRYKTNISVQIPNAEIDVSGDFETTAYNRHALYKLNQKDYFNDNLYGLYGWSDRPHISWSNPNAPENKNVLLIGNSYGNIPFSFMPLYFSSCEELDLRHFTGDFSSFYVDYAPDTIIILVNVDTVADENTTRLLSQND